MLEVLALLRAVCRLVEGIAASERELRHHRRVLADLDRFLEGGIGAVDLAQIDLELRDLEIPVRKLRIGGEGALGFFQRGRRVAGALQVLRGQDVQLGVLREGRQSACEGDLVLRAEQLEIGDVERHLLGKLADAGGRDGQRARRLAVGLQCVRQSRVEVGIDLRRGVACHQLLARLDGALPVGGREMDEPAQLEERQVLRMLLGAMVDQRLRHLLVSLTGERVDDALEHEIARGIRGEKAHPQRRRQGSIALRVIGVGEDGECRGIGRSDIQDRLRDGDHRVVLCVQLDQRPEQAETCRHSARIYRDASARSHCRFGRFFVARQILALSHRDELLSSRDRLACHGLRCLGHRRALALERLREMQIADERQLGVHPDSSIDPLDDAEDPLVGAELLRHFLELGLAERGILLESRQSEPVVDFAGDESDFALGEGVGDPTADDVAHLAAHASVGPAKHGQDEHLGGEFLLSLRRRGEGEQTERDSRSEHDAHRYFARIMRTPNMGAIRPVAPASKRTVTLVFPRTNSAGIAY